MTQYVSNPNGTVNTAGWTPSAGSTVTATADGLRWVSTDSGTKTLLGVNNSYPNGTAAQAGIISGFKMRRNSGSSLRFMGILNGVATAEALIASDTNFEMVAGRWYYMANLEGRVATTNSTGRRFYLEAVAPFDITLYGMTQYDPGTQPAGYLLTTDDATVTVDAPSNSLTIQVAPTPRLNTYFSHASITSTGNPTQPAGGSGAGASFSGTPGLVRQGNYLSLTYPTAGTYSISCETRIGPSPWSSPGVNNQGPRITKTIVVQVPSGTFTAGYSSQAEYLNVLVNAESSIAPSNDPIDTYEWDWGDGSAKSYGVEQSHTYSAAGGYPIKLTITTNETLRTNSVTKTITVQAAPNLANYFTAIRDLLSVKFSPSISNGTSYAWNFGDGATDATKTPTHVYSSPGTYTVTLTVNGNLTTSQTVTVLDAYRRLGHLNDALRLEVAVPYASGVVYNRLPNPSGSQGAYGWSTPVSGSRLTSSNTVDQPDDHGVPDAKLVYLAAGTTTQQMLSKSVRVTAGQYIGGQAVSPYAEGYFRLTVDALSGSGAVLGSSATTGYQQASASAVYTTPYLLPTGTALARLRIEFFGNNTGSAPAVNSVMLIRNAMLSTAATSAGVTNNPYISGRQWIDIAGPATNISTSRDELDVGTLTATVLESGYDPATSGTIRPGQGVRLRVKTEDNSGNVVWQPLFTGTLTNATVTYSNKLKASDPKSTRIVLAATDPTTPLTQKSQPNGVATLAELPALLEDIGVPYEVNGFSSQVPAATVVAYNENASVLDQVAITRDTTGSFAYVNRAGVLVAVDKEHLDSAVVGIIDETAYSDVDASYDTQAVINSVTIKWLRYTPPSTDSEGNPVEASTQEIVYGPYEDAASIDEWGYQPATFTMQGVENAVTISAKASAILAASKTPQRRIKTVTVPIRYLEDLSPGKALLDLYSLVQLGYTRTGSNSPARVVSVSHSITPGRWTMTLGFTPNGAVAAPQAVPSPPTPVQAVASSPGGGTPADPAELASENLNALTTATGTYAQSDTAQATTALSYPVSSLAGLLEVFRNAATTVLWQRYTATNNRTFTRTYQDTSWTAWVENVPYVAPAAKTAIAVACSVTTTASSTASTTSDVVGMLTAFTVTSTSQRFLVNVNFDVNSLTAKAGTFVGRLSVAGADQPQQAIWQSPTTVGRAFISQNYLITGLTPGTVTFKCTLTSTVASGHRVNASHSTMVITEV